MAKINLDEGKIREIVSESIKNVLKEIDENYRPKHVWVDSRVKGIGMSWYRGGHDEMTLEQLQQLLDEHDACIYYNEQFYDNVNDVPFKPKYNGIEEFGMPTYRGVYSNPSCTVVPKGTTMEVGYCSRRFKFPEKKEV